MKYIYIALLSFLLVACSEGPEEVGPVKASVDIIVDAFTSGEGTQTKAGEYERGNAPAYVSGINIKVDNLDDNTIADIEKEFLFVDNPDDGGESVSVEGVTAGMNRITAVGIAKNSPPNIWSNYKQNGDIPIVEVKDVGEMASDYSDILKNLFPVYAEYTSQSPVDVDISFPDNNEATINMVTNNHRAGVVIENASDKYRIIARVKGGSEERQVWLNNKGDRYAVMANDLNAVGNKTYTVELRYEVRTNAQSHTVTKTFDVSAGDNVTKYYRIVKDEPFVGEATGKIKWVKMTESNTGKKI